MVTSRNNVKSGSIFGTLCDITLSIGHFHFTFIPVFYLDLRVKILKKKKTILTFLDILGSFHTLKSSKQQFCRATNFTSCHLRQVIVPSLNTAPVVGFRELLFSVEIGES